MNKRILSVVSAIILIIVLVLLALPYYLGIKAQESLEEQRALLAKNSFLIIENDQYQRGWFTSTETLQMRFKPSFFAGIQQQLPDNVRTVLQEPITVVNHVRHGLFADGIRPVRAHVKTEFKFTPQAEQTLARFFGQEKPLKLENTINLSGGGVMHLEVAKFNYEELSGIKINWQGLNTLIDYTKGFNSYNSQTQSPQLDVILASKGQFSYQDLKLNSHTENGHTSISLGNSELHIKKMEFEWKDTDDTSIRLDQLVNLVTDLQIGAFINPNGGSIPSKIAVDDLFFTTQTSEQDKWINSIGKFGFAQLHYGNDDYGPLNIDVSAEHLDAASLAALKNKITQLSTQKLDNDQLREAMVAAVRQEGLGLFTHNPLFKLNSFKFQMPQGMVDVHGYLTFKDLVAGDLQQLNLMLDKTESEMDIAFPQALLESIAVNQARSLFTVDESENSSEALEDIDQTIRIMIDSVIKTMQSKGFISVENGIIKTHLKVSKGKLTLNGKPFTLESDNDDPDALEASAQTASASSTQP